MTVKLQRIMKTLEEVAQFGGTADSGTTRLSYSKEFLGAQLYLRRAMEDAGMSVELDPIGNLIGTYKGRDEALRSVMSGSHLDTVPQGGNYDGILGIVAALEVARSWQEEGYVPQRSLKVVALVEEEGTAFGRACFGAKVRSGALVEEKPENIRCISLPKSLADLLREAGLKQDALQQAAVGFGDLEAYVELHIEQGMELEDQSLQAGAVTHIVGYDRYHLVIQGEANHAGTTAMQHRHDALAGASAIVLGVQALAKKDRRFVATVGKLVVEPCVPNIVPGRVEMCIETRSCYNEVLTESRYSINKLIDQACEANGLAWSVKDDFHYNAVPLNEKIIGAVETAAKELEIKAMRMPSWAGHDAQIFAEAGVPVGMIFVPSVKGISHAKEEYSRPEDILGGVQILEKVLRGLTE